ncbi:acyltransferase family protein [Corallococcus sp. M34]|uniref:acyltransferase family protein n=1 Tax=Citreicoccus inhibens TaxID=2849499 RepID=UPI001C214E0E|nr:acyltransferase family protein [Citreicoccus inhibens]MBU8894173.1 acyltransferase family protein [Citreicoccus inhibens]
MSVSGSPPTERLAGLDALRGALSLCVVYVHAVVPFTLGATGFYYAEAVKHPLADLTFDVVHYCSMEVFFFISGFIAARQLARGGVPGLVRQRLRRIGVPLLVAGALLVPIDQGLLALGEALGFPRTQVFPTGVRPLHLWFLYYLVMLTVGTVAAAWMARWLPARLLARGERLGLRLLTRPWGALVLALPALAVRVVGPRAQYFDYRPSVGWLLYFGLFFACGAVFARRPEGFTAWRSDWPGYLLTAASLYVLWHVALPAAGLSYRAARAVEAGLMSGYGGCMVRGLVGLCLARLASPPAWLRAVTLASYWTYLVHWPVVCATQVVLAWAHAPALARLAVAAVLGVTVPVLTYHRFIHRGSLGPWLAGGREPPAASLIPHVASLARGG